jgi:hypothetical protein
MYPRRATSDQPLIPIWKGITTGNAVLDPNQQRIGSFQTSFLNEKRATFTREFELLLLDLRGGLGLEQ